MVVIRTIFLFIFCTISSFSYGADVEVTASVVAGEIWENQPINVTVTILHEKNLLVDADSFRIKDKSVTARYVKDVAFSSTDSLLLSFYQIILDGLPKGLQVLPSVSVKVGDKIFKSIPVTFEVRELHDSTAPSGASGKLKLEAFVAGPQPIYPGQRIRLVYRYIFNDNIELTKEILPLLEAAGFQKIGSTKVKDYEKDGFSVREVSQEVEAIKPGAFNFAPSFVEGYVYKVDRFGARVYEKPMINSTAASPTIIVNDFPAEGKPASFNGAIGPFNLFSVAPSSGTKVAVGDKLSLSIKIGGKGRLDSVPLPELCCQPGLSGRFQVSDLPPTTSMEGEVKTFVVDLRPLSDTITEFPEVEFSYFTPETNSYGILRSVPFKITVVAESQQKTPEVPVEEPKAVQPVFSPNPQPIEIETVKPISEGDLTNEKFSTPWVYWIFPIGAIAVAFVLYMKKKKVPVEEIISVEKSPLYLKEALLAGPKSHRFIPLASKALLTRLVEKGTIPQLVSNPEHLPDEGMAGEVRSILMELEEHRFSGQQTQLDSSIVDRIEQIYKLI